jgi:Tfp pilus assembly protein PilV
MTQQNRKGGQKGFTVIEAVVSASVFAVIVSGALAVYLATIRLDTKARSERTVQQNVRFIMDYVAKEVRNGSINYAGTNSNAALSLINQQDQDLLIEYDANKKVLTLIRDANAITTLNSADVKVTAFNIELYPDTDPFVLANDEHIQPHVTITMTVQSANTKQAESSTMSVQSTFTVREYPSRTP